MYLLVFEAGESAFEMTDLVEKIEMTLDGFGFAVASFFATQIDYYSRAALSASLVAMLFVPSFLLKYLDCC